MGGIRISIGNFRFTEVFPFCRSKIRANISGTFAAAKIPDRTTFNRVTSLPQQDAICRTFCCCKSVCFGDVLGMRDSHTEHVCAVHIGELGQS